MYFCNIILGIDKRLRKCYVGFLPELKLFKSLCEVKLRVIFNKIHLQS